MPTAQPSISVEIERPSSHPQALSPMGNRPTGPASLCDRGETWDAPWGQLSTSAPEALWQCRGLGPTRKTSRGKPWSPDLSDPLLSFNGRLVGVLLSQWR